MGKPQANKLVIPSMMEELRVVHQAILEPVRKHSYSDEAVFAIKLALDEAVTNAIRHGNGEDPDKKVTIEYVVTDESVHMTIGDEGCGFVSETLPDPTHNNHLCQPHGRGVMLMRAYMTEVHYSRSGNCVTLVKRRDCTKPHAGDMAP
jgi:serine/threonine-protein kinase RsbW